MELIEKLMRDRHSVRQYKLDEIEVEKIEILKNLIDEINEKSGSHIQLVINDSACFDDFILNYGKIVDCKNYIVLAGLDEKDLDEKMGYYGEELVLKAMELGLNSCWVAGSYKRRSVKVDLKENERMVCVIALGYGVNNGSERRKKSFGEVCESSDVPSWFSKGVELALLAPTAINQQKFKLYYLGSNNVRIKVGIGPYVKIDLGIVKYHFEIGALIDGGIKVNWVK